MSDTRFASSGTVARRAYDDHVSVVRLNDEADCRGRGVIDVRDHNAGPLSGSSAFHEAASSGCNLHHYRHSLREWQTTAAATINEAVLPGFERALRRAGREIPQDFRMVGVAARLWVESFQRELAAADVPAAEIAGTGVELLLEPIAESAAPPRHVLICLPISLRASTGPRVRN